MSNLVSRLENYDLARKVYAMQNIELLSQLAEAEAQKEEPNLAAISGLGLAIAQLLSAVI